MKGKSRTRLILASIFCLILCQIMTACSNSSKINSTPAAYGQKANSAGPEDNSVEKAVYTEDDDNFKSWLLAQIPEKDIFLYAQENGVTLHVRDKEHYYEWLYMTPRGILPRMQVADYDGDGKEELSVILYIGSGTGVSVEELHIIEISEETEILKDHMFSNYTEQLQKAIGFKTYNKDGEKMAEIMTPNGTYTVSLEDYNEESFGKIAENLFFGSIVRFGNDNGKLTAGFGAGVCYEKHVVPYNIGEVIADVEYKDGVFELKNYKFSE
ncbi:MAG: hypothetical protein GX660_14720 [Clostridiaceae bacterium]|nr:hypothetical protein [Clostridiaceae bacterium]